MKTYYSVENQITIELIHEQGITQNEELVLSAYVPGIKKSSQVPEKIDLSVTYDGVAGFAQKLYGLLRRELLTRKQFCVHGACVSIHKRVLIIGHSGSGKTTVALNLLEQGARIDSGNKTIVSFINDKLFMNAGTTAVSIKNTDSIPDILMSNNRVEVWDRIIIDYQSEAYGEIDAVVVVKLNSYKNILKQVVGDSRVHMLYPYFMDAVNADVVLDDNDDVLVGRAPEGTERYLSQHLRKTTVPVYTIEGALEFVTDEIKKL
ncbi:MAG: hypothetical protein WCG20_01985 [bacterium]